MWSRIPSVDWPALVLYRLVNKVVKTEILDRVITAVGMILFVAFILLRLLVFKVRY